MRSLRAGLALVVLVPAVAVIASCGESKPILTTSPPVASVVPSASASADAFVDVPEKSVPPLLSGAAPTLDHPEMIEATINGRHIDGAYEVIELALGAAASTTLIAPREVTISEGITGAAPLAVVGRRAMDPQNRGNDVRTFVYVRRLKTDEAKPLVGRMDSMWLPEHPGETFHFRAPATANAKEDRAVYDRWLETLRGRMERDSSFGVYATRRLTEMLPAPKVEKPGKRRVPASVDSTGGVLINGGGSYEDGSDNYLFEAMGTLSGAESVERALQSQRSLTATPAAKRTVPIATVSGPQLDRHPWGAMLSALGKPVPPEPLADAIPADGWYVRAKNISALFRLIEQTDSWGTPFAAVLDRRGENRDLLARYEAQLGLSRGPLTKALGPDVIAELAATGSDPYLREGSDVTVVFRVKSKMLFDAGSSLSLQSHTTAHGALTTTTVQVGSVTVQVARSVDGVVRQHRATVGDLEIVSNSLGGIRRVLGVLAKTSPALSAEPDFRYMLARDPGVRDDVLAFAGDRFILGVAGPTQKIAESRRLFALAQLQVPAYASLLYGIFNGVSPATVADLTKAKLLTQAQLEHAPSDPIAFVPGSAPRSSWGTPTSLTPLVDLPPVATVTAEEKRAYEQFSGGYSQSWNEHVDPIALRLAIEDDGLTADVRILPIVRSSSYRDLRNQVGTAHVSAPNLASGVRFLLGVGKDAELRRDLMSEARHSPLGDLSMDWLGEWAMIGCADRPSLLAGPFRSLRANNELPNKALGERSGRMFGELDDIAKMPLYAGIQVKSTAAATFALIAVRKFASDAAPGQLEWGETSKYRGTSIVRIAAKDPTFPEGTLSLFYAMDGDSLLFSLREAVLRELLDNLKDGKGPTTATDAASTTQSIFDAGLPTNSPLTTLATWFLEQAAVRGADASRAEAWSLFHGAPEVAKNEAAAKALALAYLGEVPTPPDGGAYTLADDGVSDPNRGTYHAPRYPALPVPGSAAEKALTSIGGLRIETSFDDEPRVGAAEPERSLHTRVSVRGRK